MRAAANFPPFTGGLRGVYCVSPGRMRSFCVFVSSWQNSMDMQELTRIVREQYPFPIAYAYKKTLGVPDENVEKLKCLLETAETTIQFLALLALAQVRHDLLHDTAPNPGKLQAEIGMTNPSLGKWKRLACEVLKAYAPAKAQLLVPELFDVFWAWDAARQRLCAQPIGNKAIDPLIALRNDFHHGRVPDSDVRERVTEGLQWLRHLLAAIRFITAYQLSFTQRILLSQDSQRKTCYVHDLTLFQGCVSGFDRQRWQSDIHLEPDAVILLNPAERRHLILNPFLIFTEQAQGVADLCLLNNLVQKKAIYVSCQFGKEAATNDAAWTAGPSYYEALQEFSDLLQRVPQMPPLAPDSEETGEMPIVLAEESRLSTAEVFDRKYRQNAKVVEHASPYKFLDYYNPEDQDLFFGRDQEIRSLRQKFYQSRLLVLHGESGTGKTSLIRAGLMPQLDPESYMPVYVRVLKEPLQEIKRELIRQLGLEGSSFPSREGLGVGFPSWEGAGVGFPSWEGAGVGSSLAGFLLYVTERVSKTVVIVLDQFEEFFLRFSEEVRAQFEQELATCIDTPRLDVKVLIALRADYFSCLASFEASLPQIFTHQLQLERLTEAQALEAVIKPAQRLGIQVDEPMAQIKLLPDLLADEGGIEPPLLQIVCAELYEHAQREGRREIGLADYEALGDVKRCLGRYLEAKLRQFGKAQRTAKGVLKALVTTEGTKRASFLPELQARMHTLGVEFAEETLQQKYLDKFVRDRLVRVEDVEGEARYELSHDYLAKQIEAWLAESEREITKALELIDRAYETYRATNVLLERSALQMIKPFEEQLVLPPDKQTFVERSQTQARKQRRGLWLKVAAALIFVALVVGGVFGYQLYKQYHETLRERDQTIMEREKVSEQYERAEKKAEQQSKLATALAKKNLQQSEFTQIEEMNLTAEALWDADDPLNALLSRLKAGLALKQARPTPNLTIETFANLRNIVNTIYDKNRLEGHDSRICSIGFHPDGKVLAVGSENGTITFWNVNSGRKIGTYPIHTRKVNQIAWSPDGMKMASASDDGTVRIVTFDNGSEFVLRTHTSAVRSIAFSSDNKLLASGSFDQSIKLWNVLTGEEIKTFQQKTGVSSVTFNPDGTMLAADAGNGLGEISLWDISTGNQIKTFQGELIGLGIHLEFSPDGTVLTASYGNGKTIFWNILDGKKFGTLLNENERVSTIEGSLLAERDGCHLNIKDAKNGREIITLPGYLSKYVMENIACRPDGKLLASVDTNGTAIRLQDMQRKFNKESPVQVDSITLSSDRKTLIGVKDNRKIDLWSMVKEQKKSFGEWKHVIENVLLTPDGGLLTATSQKNTIILRDVLTDKEIVTLHGHAGDVTYFAFSPDGKLLASGSKDNTIKLWNLAERKEYRTLQGYAGNNHTWSGPNIAFSPDGQLLASIVGEGKNIKLWNISNGSEFASLEGHTYPVTRVVFSSDGTKLVSVGSSGELGQYCELKLWNVTDRTCYFTKRSELGDFHNVIFSPDGKMLASGAIFLSLWNATNGEQLPLIGLYGEAQIESMDSGVIQAFIFSPDSKILASIKGFSENKMIFFNVDTDPDIEPLLAQGCEWLHDYLKTNPNVSATDRALCADLCQSPPQRAPLSADANARNQQKARRRVLVEHALGGVQRLRAVTDRRRNRLTVFANRLMAAACGVWNVHVEMAASLSKNRSEIRP